ncbi:PepSY domain-containing protein [Frigoribacterium sp. CFBP9030]|uniref:PepSY domain-containing protein n=1 Tax=Frigoribacterium sp. CFBP9030 TaxID=3096537 RepID=UPI002A6B5DCE|nr:PepSY domain-containing protein [Frigoribacterium sp. CFBP9030]MDY0892166.1 hypothetical protein [Frigoribacterium sp. CFBP9030]
MKKKTMIIAGAAAAVIVLAGGGIAVASTLDDRVSASDRESVSQAALAEVGSGVVTDVDRLDDGLEGYEVDVTRDDGREVSVLLDGEGAVVSSRVDDRGDSRDSDDDGSTGSTGSTGSVDADDRDGDDVATGSAPGAPTTGDRDDAELTGADYDRASAAAIEAAGGGVVTDADRSDDRDVAYEVDVRLDDGTEVDVDLDADFGVVRTDVDSPRR